MIPRFVSTVTSHKTKSESIPLTSHHRSSLVIGPDDMVQPKR